MSTKTLKIARTAHKAPACTQKGIIRNEKSCKFYVQCLKAAEVRHAPLYCLPHEPHVPKGPRESKTLG